MKIKLKIFPLLLAFGLLSSAINAQRQVDIVIVSDNAEDEHSENAQFAESFRVEIEALLKSSYDLNFQIIYTAYDLGKIVNAFESSFSDDESDIILASGPMSSNVLAQWSSYAKPSIATLILDTGLQRVPFTEDETSGVDNFTYVQSPFDAQRDLKTLHQIYPYKNLGVIGVEESVRYSPALDNLFKFLAGGLGATYTFIPAKSSVAATLEGIPDSVDAIYMLPLFDVYDRADEVELMTGINALKIPSAGIIGEEVVEPGALMGYEATNNFQRIPRRAALNVSKILEGENAANLPVLIPTYNENLLINMATADKIKIYPSWDMMGDATLLKVDEMDSENKWTLRTAIMEALQSNLELNIARKDPLIAEKDVALAKAEYMPTLDASANLAIVDNITAFSFQGTRGRYSLLASGSLSQLVFSEPALANIAIQGYLLKGQEAAMDQTQLDVILDVSEAYFGILQAKRGLRIQNENVNVTKRNLDIAKAKAAVGYSGVTDINRFESELALANIELNNAQASLRQARFNFNQLLNRPIDQDFQLEDITFEGNDILFLTDPRMGNLINNPGDLEIFADFMVTEAFRQLPEIRQLEASIAATERQLLSNRRAFTMPSIAVSGGVDYLIDTWDYPEGINRIDLDATWNLGVGLQYPIFQGGKRKINVDQTKLSLLQLQDQKQNLFNQLEFLIRANLETVGASFSSTVLSQDAANAARENFKIVQDYYSQGQVNITSLIDAQNTALQTELTAVNAVYQFFADFIAMERSVGSYYFLSDNETQQAYFQRLIQFISERK